jgi:hypothetical protein
MALPWKLSKVKSAAIRADASGASLEKLNRLFNVCFRIREEASMAAGHQIPLIVENVRGAIPWVGRSRWNYGSFHLWGDVPALMPITSGRLKLKGDNFLKPHYSSGSYKRKMASAMIAKIPAPLARHIGAIFRP